MGRLKLNPDPTFKEKVEIHVPGAKPEKVEFTFKYRTRDELAALMEELDKIDDVKLIMKLANAWELEDDFTEENVKQLAQSYLSAPKAILETYLGALTGVRAKN
jgi:hypothetical protein